MRVNMKYFLDIFDIQNKKSVNQSHSNDKLNEWHQGEN